MIEAFKTNIPDFGPKFAKTDGGGSPWLQGRQSSVFWLVNPDVARSVKGAGLEDFLLNYPRLGGDTTLHIYIIYV